LRTEHASENNSESYPQTLNKYLAAKGAKRWVPTNSNPTLNEIRGKFVILQEFSGYAPDGKPYGLSYGAIDKQDDYAMSTNWESYDKWTTVLSLTLLSVATQARVNCFIGICTIAFGGTNTLTADYIANACYDSGVAWQKWSYDASTGLLRNKANPAYCLDNMGQPYAGGGIQMWPCDASNVNQQWNFVGNNLRSKANGNISVDAYGRDSGSKVGLWSNHGGSNQQWTWGN
jgi:1-phosphatidylinositol phosphodiesterase